MRSKSFLSGIFSVVSFILIANLAIPSTFAKCPTDVSGKWVVKRVEMNECCTDQSDNGQKKGTFVIPVVTQVGNEISASWDENVLTGVVNGNSVYLKVEYNECVSLKHVVGIIKGNRIMFYGSGDDECGSCRWHVKGTIKIVK